MKQNWNIPNLRCDVLDVPGASNVRDIGGYPGAGGRPVAKRRFIRSGRVNELTEAGVRAVRELGVQCVVDLRSTFECARMPDTLREDAQIAYIHVPMLDYIQSEVGGEEPPQFPDSMTEMYIGLLEKSGDSFLRVFQAFADPAYRTVLFHCTAGKDRTGLSAMLLLGLAGVSHEDIIEDYSHSDKLDPQKQNHPSIPGYLFESKPETMAAAIDHLVVHYGGIVPYLAHIGVDDAMQRAVLAKLF